MNEKGFTNKEILNKMMNRFDRFEDKFGKRLERTHDIVVTTDGKVGAINGRVRLHTKIIWGLAGAGFSVTLFLTGWMLNHSGGA